MRRGVRVRSALSFTALLLTVPYAGAQLSLTSAVDLALRTSPRVQMAQAEVERARAAVSEARDVFIPTLTGGSGLGYSYGFPVGQPTLYNFQAQSLVFNFSQFDYIRAARFGLSAADLSLIDARQNIAADTALTWVALERDEQRDQALGQQNGFADRMATIAQERFDAGRDSAIELTTARLTAAQIRLARLRAADETAADRDHLARLLGLPASAVRIDDGSFPGLPEHAPDGYETRGTANPAVAAAYANAQSKAQQAYGDARYLYRPQIAFGASYARFARYNNYDLYYQRFQANNAEIGVQVTLPLFDRAHQAKALESAAAARSARFEADYARDQVLDAEVKLSHATAELRARAEVAALDQLLAQQQLDAMLVQLNVAQTSSGTPLTPKDEQLARISEREKYLVVLDTTLQLRQAEINLLRQRGELEGWLKSVAGQAPAPSTRPRP